MSQSWNFLKIECCPEPCFVICLCSKCSRCSVSIVSLWSVFCKHLEETKYFEKLFFTFNQWVQVFESFGVGVFLCACVCSSMWYLGLSSTCGLFLCGCFLSHVLCHATASIYAEKVVWALVSFPCTWNSELLTCFCLLLKDGKAGMALILHTVFVPDSPGNDGSKYLHLWQNRRLVDLRPKLFQSSSTWAYLEL